MPRMASPSAGLAAPAPPASGRNPVAPAPTTGRTATGNPSGPTPAAPATGGRVASRSETKSKSRSKTPRRPPRLASLQLKRIDPWTVLKISLIVSIVMFFVWMIAVGILYLSLGSMDVWSKINDTYNTLTTSADANATASDLITPARVFSITAVVGAINIVLFTALATVAAFVYNAAAGMAGGVEVTLGERD